MEKMPDIGVIACPNPSCKSTQIRYQGSVCEDELGKANRLCLCAICKTEWYQVWTIDRIEMLSQEPVKKENVG